MYLNIESILINNDISIIRNKKLSYMIKIRGLSEKFDRLNKAGKDTTNTYQRLADALEEFLLFRRKGAKTKLRGE